ncbi:DnaJ-like cysteine-rich domain-containing protein [Ferruginibacter sp.]
MKKTVLLIPALIFCTLFATAQKTTATAAKKPVVDAEKEPPITDTFAYNIQTTIHKLALFVQDAERPIELLTQNYLGIQNSCQPYYTAIVRFPGAAENIISRVKADHDKGVILWEWTSYLVKAPKGEFNKQSLLDLTTKMLDIAKNINTSGGDDKNGIQLITGYTTADWGFGNTDEVKLIVQFYKPGYQTEQQSIDSLKALYLPGFKSIETAGDATKKFSAALLGEGLSKEKAVAILGAELRKAADIDIKIAYQMLMGCDYDLKAKDLMAVLDDSQREKIRVFAQAFLDAYKEQRPFDIKTFDPNPPPAPVYTYQSGGNTYTGTVNPNLFAKPAPEGKRVHCPVCGGRGQVEIVDYSHTYSGIFSTITTQSTHWAMCSYCGGGGWVTKYKK